MWISKLELTCFKSYQHQAFNFPAPEDGRNIVLIGGMNGFGKTSILEALYLCLYGKEAIIHLARAGLKTDDKKGYPTFLEGAFNGEAKRRGSDTMMVRVTINRTKIKAIDICRKWFFRSNGDWTGEEEAVVREVLRDIPNSPRVDGKNGFHFSELLDEVFVPAHVAPFFFFDGEEVKKLADQSRVEQVKQGLEGLLGVVLIRSLSDRLRSFEATKRDGVVSVDEHRLNQLAEQLDISEVQLIRLREDSQQDERKKVHLRAEHQSLLERITSSGGGGGDIATVKELVEEREQNRNKLRESHRTMEDILSGRLPFHLVPKKLTDRFKTQLSEEIKWFCWDTEKRSLEPRKVEFRKAFNSQSEPPITPALSVDQQLAIEARLEAAWGTLFYPPPNDCAKEIIHDYLHETQREEALEFLSSIDLGQKEIQDLLSVQQALQQRIDDLGRKISRVEGIDHDGTLTTLKNQLEEVQNKIEALTDQLRANDRAIIALEAQVRNMRADYMREKGNLDDSSPVRAVIEKSERVRKVLDEVIPALFPLKVKALGRAMTDVYKQLAHKQQVDKIDITDEGTARILSTNGREITFDRSAGENQIFATALIAGLAKVSGVKAPMVVDTPLGRLDSKHRDNILKFWTADKTRQVILLSQDEEIDFHLYKDIMSSVCKTYLLDHEDVGDGIGRTAAKEGKYFARGRR
ncbi:DNA sulfur modification protein DndD [Nitrosospira sp. Nsp5]|uniref:DNA sulfur modification protein DndD n=2 Tax=Nitrosospira TaxID=35798 RepID=A0ABY0TL84_9PROT|nr:DNA sulfur modification protein DndD [Nitrosospira multiformis]PTR09948.1 DNA sulfur modification protein DndD [Nitrosospira sp. Nsp5]SDR00687.1 DNA sulfur modification protein DndD [Nitrosospira multiformis]